MLPLLPCVSWFCYQFELPVHVVLPGLRQFDEGERFDLRSPYADDGWVDPEETDMLSGTVHAVMPLMHCTPSQHTTCVNGTRL